MANTSYIYCSQVGSNHNNTYLYCSQVGFTKNDTYFCQSATASDIVVNGVVQWRFYTNGTIDSGMTL